MVRLWKIKNWLKYEPAIFCNRIMAKLANFLAEGTDRLGYLLFGKKRWEKCKKKLTDKPEEVSGDGRAKFAHSLTKRKDKL